MKRTLVGLLALTFLACPAEASETAVSFEGDVIPRSSDAGASSTMDRMRPWTSSRRSSPGCAKADHDRKASRAVDPLSRHGKS
ncbi:hypothetical protein [Kibdelosporangium philippinense]|uniref:hypothetical protein n=1 Tax=Kibdelosporangium philippinense TaxID=211113 RepID=UPI00361C7557